MKEIEVGEYVRTDKGYITKETDVNFIRMMKENKSSFGKPTKHSKNIIDLIEIGDIVNKEKVIEVHSDLGYIFVDKETELGTKTFCDYQIETIITKEQYEQNCYRLEAQNEQ